MTRRLRVIVLAAIVAALFGAPSAVFGAAPTRLFGATASPTSGTTTTIFTFSVRFDGSGKFSAGAVLANVAGRTLTMARISGNGLLGTYAASTTLPAGSWTVSFESAPASGPAASLTGPTVSVAAPMPTPKPGTPIPTSTTVSAPSDPPPSSTSVAIPVETAPTSTMAAAPTVAVSPSSAVGSGGDIGAATPGPASPDTTPGGSERGAGSNTGGGTRSTAGAGQPAPKASAATDAPDASASGVNPSANGSAGAEAGPRDAGPLKDNAQLAYILAAIAAVTAFGAFVMLLWRRRDDDDDSPALATPLPAPAAATPGKLGPRAMRRGRSEQANDPILESMGLNEGTDDSRIAVNASQVHRGPGVREPQVRRR
jgi:hypothetical protein